MIAVLITILLSTVGVAGDYFLKVASSSERPFATGAFALGLGLIASTAFGAVLAMRQLKLASLASVYCVSTILLLALIGRVSFHEKLSHPEMVGVACAVLSVILLFRIN